MVSTLMVESEFSAAGTLFILAMMFVPLLVSWGMSVYENRLSVYFSEQVGEPVNLGKGQVIGSVMGAYFMPLLAISFGLLVLWNLTESLWPTAGDGSPAEHGLEKLAAFAGFTLVSSLAGVLAAKALLFRKHLRGAGQEEARGLFLRWVRRVNIAGTVLNVGVYWTGLLLFPELALLTLN